MGVQIKVVRRLRGRKSAKLASNTDAEKTDIVIPFNFYDNLKAWRIGISVNTFRFNARMDQEKLRAALERLFEMEGWKKLGARIRLTKDVSGVNCWSWGVNSCMLTSRAEKRRSRTPPAPQIRRKPSRFHLVLRRPQPVHKRSPTGIEDTSRLELPGPSVLGGHTHNDRLPLPQRKTPHQVRRLDDFRSGLPRLSRAHVHGCNADLNQLQPRMDGWTGLFERLEGVVVGSGRPGKRGASLQCDRCHLRSLANGEQQRDFAGKASVVPKSRNR